MKSPRKSSDRHPVTVRTHSGNAKTGPVTVTYAPQTTCPASCPLRGKGCYAEAGPIGIITRRLASDATSMSRTQLAQAEADAIDAAPARSHLRLHAVGDCATESAAKIVAAACERYEERGRAYGVRSWTYTHAWRTVPRSAWGGVSVLASCHSVREAEEAMDRGYAAAVVVELFDDGHKAWDELGVGSEVVTLVPCPHQTKKVQCIDCLLCTEDWKLADTRRAIAFRAHGASRKSVLKSLPMAEA